MPLHESLNHYSQRTFIAHTHRRHDENSFSVSASSSSNQPTAGKDGERHVCATQITQYSVGECTSIAYQRIFLYLLFQPNFPAYLILETRQHEVKMCETRTSIYIVINWMHSPQSASAVTVEEAVAASCVSLPRIHMVRFFFLLYLSSCLECTQYSMKCRTWTALECKHTQTNAGKIV